VPQPLKLFLRCLESSISDVLGMCYILCMCVCVCVCASDSKTASDGPSSSALCVVCAGRFLGGSKGGPGMPPLGYTQHLKFFFGRFLLFLVVF
jgi:hypothetical protein